MAVLRNPKHEIFAQELATGKHVFDAYKHAGFKRPRDSNARRLRNTPEIRERVKEIALVFAEEAGVHSGAVQLELARLGFANMCDYVEIGDDGLPYVNLRKLTREQAAAISEFSVDTIEGKDKPTVTRVKFKLHDKRGALSDLAKILGVVKEPVADALTGMGEKLDRALQRSSAA
jgi:phage terminase small subunit